MDQTQLQTTLSDLPLGELRYLPSLGSTNDEALVWAAQGAPDLSLVVADEQTAGRGRAGRRWFTPPGSALAFSLILRPPAAHSPHHTRMVGMAALAVAEALIARGLEATIKWPNDVLIAGRKAAGILLESVWLGSQVDFSIVGIGLNVARTSVPQTGQLNFPATSLEEALGALPAREQVLHDILARVLPWRARLESDQLLERWQELLAFRGEQVEVTESSGPPLTGRLLGLASDGSLRLLPEDGNPMTVYFGDVRLRPAL
jgi:BirA family biotin operon repressor/biotin-[acetyl-CoA-carboxylase] ligase